VTTGGAHGVGRGGEDPRAGAGRIRSHTKLDGRYVLRLAVGNVRTARRHVERAWALLRAAAALG
jgi:hypothetical protein